MYVEVNYLDKHRHFIESKRKTYLPLAAEDAYNLMITKLTRENKIAIVMIRSDDHELIKSHAVNFDPAVVVKPITYKELINDQV